MTIASFFFILGALFNAALWSIAFFLAIRAAIKLSRGEPTGAAATAAVALVFLFLGA